MELLINLPVLLAIVLFVGIVVLVKVLLSPDILERRCRSDRRRADSTPRMPFYDSGEKRVSKDRRLVKVSDRRKHVFIITPEQKRTIN